ncbi:hypothetical protein TNCV_2507471 [Trichonephila clavipes]|nr:hypothetical protein TNCV_2507471 [Trichonephila clavipes]
MFDSEEPSTTKGMSNLNRKLKSNETNVELRWRKKSQVKWGDIENYVEFLSKEMPDIKIDGNCLFEVERRLNVHSNSNKLEQLENQHAEKLMVPRRYAYLILVLIKGLAGIPVLRTGELKN